MIYNYKFCHVNSIENVFSFFDESKLTMKVDKTSSSNERLHVCENKLEHYYNKVDNVNEVESILICFMEGPVAFVNIAC